MTTVPPPQSLESATVPSAGAAAPEAAGGRFWQGLLEHLRDLIEGLIQRNLRDNEVALLVVSSVIGTVIGAGVVLIQMAVQFVHEINFGLPSGQHLSNGQAVDWWRVLVVPTVGGLLAGTAGVLIRRSRKRETVDAVEANALFGGKMSLTDSSTLTLLTVISAGFGASVGMEAGFTQLGSGFASRVGQSLRMRRGDLRTLVGCGAAAAIAAAFNAPLAGAFYAFELVIGSYSPPVLAPISLAALTATLMVRDVFGGESIFTLDTPIHIAGLDYALFAAVGLVAAAISIATMTGVSWVESLFRRLKVPAWLRPCIGGLLVGWIAAIFPQVLGSGHGAVELTLAHTFPTGILLGLIAAKGLASAISVGSGFRGGLFSSSLLLGSVYGGAVVVMLQWALTAAGLVGITLDQNAYMLVGMGAVAAAIVGAPVTMIFLVLELTGDFPAALGVMVGVIIASVTTRLTFGYSFATWRFHLRGVPIRGGYDVGWMQELTVGKLMRTDIHLAPMGMTVAAFRQQYPLGGVKRVFLVDAENRYRGIIAAADVHNPDLDADAARPIDDLRAEEDQFLLPHHNIRTALNRFVVAEAETLAVVSDSTHRQVVGFVTEGYALRRYNQELERVRAEELGDRALFGPG
ncbi:MAG TPA: chloride channel protein [Stellaceae bacterium]|nr:chloride channel protein [Stellaceae bacterium]